MSSLGKGPHTYGLVPPEDSDLGPGSGGQSGDMQGLSDIADVDSESVVELLQEGQFYEAEVVSGIENSFVDEVGEVHTKEVPLDDVGFEDDDQEKFDG
jgi:hypothetical protein